MEGGQMGKRSRQFEEDERFAKCQVCHEAWYIFSALGFYPVLPGSDKYAIGSPMVQKATLHFENGNTLIINTVNQGKENVYVAKVEVNGKAVEGNNLKHNDLVNGGNITFYLQSAPLKN